MKHYIKLTGLHYDLGKSAQHNKIAMA